jgi:Ca-activated chloride channel family protein
MQKKLFLSVISLALTLFIMNGCSNKSKEDNNLDSGAKTQKEETKNNKSKNNQNNQKETPNSCEDQYQSKLKEKGENFDNCRVNISAGSCEEGSGTSDKINNTVLILDVSGSMAAQVDGKSRLEIAKNVLGDYVNSLDKESNISIILYGHEGNNSTAQKQTSCQGIEVAFPLGKADFSQIKGKINQLKPTGWTPIEASLDKAVKILKDYQGENYNNSILLISDGKETCNGDPIAKAKTLSQDKNLNLAINVIGFDVTGDDQQQLSDIAENGKGQYFDVKLEQELKAAMQKHEEFMKNFECQMKLFDENLNQGLDSLFSYNECVHKLDMEKFEIELDADLGNGITESCEDYVLEKYQTRYDKIKSELDKNYKEDKEKVEKNNPLDDNDNDSDLEDLDLDIDVDIDEY